MELLGKIFELYIGIPIGISRFISNIISKFDYALARNYLMKKFCKVLEEESEEFYSYRERPKCPSEKGILECNVGNDKDIAIVIQGPILKENNFTIETIKWYRKICNDIAIILSTWEDEDENLLFQIKELDVEVVTSKKPLVSGLWNMNFQVISTKAGIKRAKEMGKKYVCKTRTDQRLYRQNVFCFMKGLIEQFPSQVNGQNGRVVCIGAQHGSMVHPYFMSDFLYFGSIEEIEKLFLLEIDTRNNEKIKVSEYTLKEMVDNDLSPESVILSTYVRKIGLSNESTIKSYWDMVKRALVCIDFEDVGLYWPKYDTRYSENERYGYYFSKNARSSVWKKFNFGFVEWFNLYMGNISVDDVVEMYINERMM